MSGFLFNGALHINGSHYTRERSGLVGFGCLIHDPVQCQQQVKVASVKNNAHQSLHQG
jgi:hypothetical protein